MRSRKYGTISTMLSVTKLNNLTEICRRYLKGIDALQIENKAGQNMKEGHCREHLAKVCSSCKMTREKKAPLL
uniref:Uncharacterized protein n=1 Tax=Onchocerca volvulus TaxID=6282 RepID=A0A8R1U0L3_ONCVO